MARGRGPPEEKSKVEITLRGLEGDRLGLGRIFVVSGPTIYVWRVLVLHVPAP
jgi:hypothetical protein